MDPNFPVNIDILNRSAKKLNSKNSVWEFHDSKLNVENQWLIQCLVANVNNSELINYPTKKLPVLELTCTFWIAIYRLITEQGR